MISAEYNLSGQSAAISTGKTVTSDSGSISYSVGQVNFKFIQSNSGSSSEGVQQAIIIEGVSQIDEKMNNLEVILYPNPTNNDLFIVHNNPLIIAYDLMDVSYRVLSNGQINSRVTKLELSDFPAGTYFIKLHHLNNKNLRTFKILKK